MEATGSLPTASVFLRQLFGQAVEAVRPAPAVRKVVRVAGGGNDVVIHVDGRAYRDVAGVAVVGFGKAVADMARALYQQLSASADTAAGASWAGGVLSVPVGGTGIGPGALPPQVRVFAGAEHNLPDAASAEAARAIAYTVQTLPADHLLFVLISGGGSALLPAPRPPLTLADKTEVVRQLSLSSASIDELNVVRRRLSTLKGGRLAQLARGRGRRLAALILSDIIDDPLDLIASGPTVAPSSSSPTAEDVLGKYGVSVTGRLADVLEASRDERPTESYDHVQNVLVGNNALALKAMKEAAAKSLGRDVGVAITSPRVSGPARQVGAWYAQLAYLACQGQDTSEELAGHLNFTDDAAQEVTRVLHHLRIDDDAEEKRVCLIGGGETTVLVQGKGRGGRNQELALSFSQQLDRLNGGGRDISGRFEIDFMSAGTDGIDGPTDAAGAIVDLGLAARAREQGMGDLEGFLQDNDSYTFFSQLSGGRHLLKCGHTGTNVMDVHILMITKKKPSPRSFL